MMGDAEDRGQVINSSINGAGQLFLHNNIRTLFQSAFESLFQG